MSLQAGAEEDKGIIGKLYEDGVPVLYSFVNEMPAAEVRDQLQWLSVISWKYDGGENRGMPPAEDNQKMMRLEDAIQEHIDGEKVLRHAYSRTGSNLKALVYYRDGKWKHFEELMDDFSAAAEK